MADPAGRGLVAGIETEVKVRHGIPASPTGMDINTGGVAVHCLVGADPDRPNILFLYRATTVSMDR